MKFSFIRLIDVVCFLIIWCGTPFPHQIIRKTAANSSNIVIIRLQEFPHCVFLFYCSATATVLYTRQLVISSFMLLQALHVETEMKNLNLQVILFVHKGVDCVPFPLHPCAYCVDIIKARWLLPVFAKSYLLYVWIRPKNLWVFVFEMHLNWSNRLYCR